MNSDGNAVAVRGKNAGDATASGFGWAWLFLGVALALHVTDEATHDFLSFYNPTVLAIRARFPFLPLPVFSFAVWWTGLCLGVLLLLGLSLPAFRGVRLVVWLAYPLAVVMFINGLGHIGFSLVRNALVPGVYSSPLLLIASAHLFWRARRPLRASVEQRA
jgi:hypothetical protein